jgi:hypothetical protein
MAAIGPYGSAPAEARVEPPRRAHREALHPRGERHAVIGLDQHVNVIALHRVLGDARVLAPRLAHGLTKCLVEELAAKIRQPFARRSVTCTGGYQRCSGHARCRTFARFAAVLPAPGRGPPHDRRSANESCPAAAPPARARRSAPRSRSRAFAVVDLRPFIRWGQTMTTAPFARMPRKNRSFMSRRDARARLFVPVSFPSCRSHEVVSTSNARRGRRA